MNNDDQNPKIDCNAISRAFRDFILEAPAEELPELSKAFGESSEALIEKAMGARKCALDEVRRIKREETDPSTLRHGFSTLLQLLCRRDGIDQQDLARSARVDVDEICRIETDIHHTPSPRTIYQLEKVFNLPSGIFAKLAGIIRFSNEAVEKEVLEFATNAKSIGKLTAEERKLLNSFVQFLAKRG
jgi:transcriptional regulator with XRE-family HTH domain